MQLTLAGGFLGSGKTTAIISACHQLIQQNKKVAVITNDQGDQQVDSAFVRSFGILTKEVGNGCFCCRYDELDNHLQTLQATDQPDIIFAESVGSCTDLIATIVKPLSKYKPEVTITVSVFVDAGLLASVIEGRSSFLEESVQYIFRKQMEEADILILNKIDLLTPDQRTTTDRVIRSDYPGKLVMHQNSMNETDVSNWLKAQNEFTPGSKRTSLTVDYDVYGEGEAKLAWLDKSIIIDAHLGNGVFAARHIMRSIFNRLQRDHHTIGHLKFFLETDQWTGKVSFTTSSTSADIKIRKEEARTIKMLINARVQAEPAAVERIINSVLMEARDTYHCAIVAEKQASFKPGYPMPTHRLT